MRKILSAAIMLIAMLMLFGCTPSPGTEGPGEDPGKPESPFELPDIPDDILQEKPALNTPAWLWGYTWQFEAPNTENTITIAGSESDFSISSSTAYYAIGSIAEAIAGKGKIVSESISEDELGYELKYVLYTRTDSEYVEETVTITMEYTPAADGNTDEALHVIYKPLKYTVDTDGEASTISGTGFSFQFRSL